MDETTQTDAVVVPVATEETPQNPVQKELERVRKEAPSRKEKLLYTQERIAKQLAEEFPDIVVEEDLDKPLTRKDLKDFQRKQIVETAFILADDVEDEYERELAKYHLEHTVKPSGNPKKDLENALVLVNAVKNKQIIEEVSRGTPPKNHSSAAGAPARPLTNEPELTSEELNFMRSFGLSKAQIIAARSK